MNKLILALTLALSFTVQAQSSIDTCRQVENGAKTIMEIRQIGMEMGKAMDIMKDSEMGMKMVIKAYETPMWSTKRNKDKAILKFSNRAMLECLKVMKNKG